MLSDELCCYPIPLTLNVLSLVATITLAQSLLFQCVSRRLGLSRSSGRTAYLTELYQSCLILFCNVISRYEGYTFKCLSQALLFYDSRGRLCEKLARKRRTVKWPQQHHQQRTAQGWFSEYVRNRRPLSTTWPWSIRPSLAVIWGVCWMFHGDKGGSSNRIPPNMLGDNALYDIDEAIEWSYPGGNTAVRQPLAQAATSNAVRRSRSDSGLHVTGPGLGSRQPRPNLQELSGRDRSRFRGSSIAHQYASNASPHHTVPSNNYDEGTSLTDNSPALLPSHGSLIAASTTGIITQADPRYNEFLGPMFLGTPNLDYQSRPQLPLQGPSQLTNNTVSQLTFCAPETRTVAATATAPLLNSEDVYYTPSDNIATAAYNNLGFPLGELAFRGGTGSVGISGATVAASNKIGLSPLPSNIMRPPSSIEMRSPESEPSPPASSSYMRKASLSSSSAAVPAPSEEDRSPAMRPAEAPPTNRSRPIRRTESPPLNVNKKMTCKFAECAGITFERKCEWSKHMDKHDRPYKCTAPGCEKLLGFTYSGGLLRHEREVHKMHGGTKAPLYCPYTGCKRSAGDGFTRRENLSEHIRRVHQRMSATPAGAGVGSSGSGSGMMERGGRRSSSTTRLKLEEGRGYTRSPSVDPATLLIGESNAKTKKRRREEADDGDTQGRRDDDDEDSEIITEHGRPGSDVQVREYSNNSDLRGEVKRLKRELSLRDIRLQELQATVDRLSGSREQHQQHQHQRSPHW